MDPEKWEQLRAFVDSLGYPVEILVMRDGKWDREVWDAETGEWRIVAEFTISSGYYDEIDYDPNSWQPGVEST
jgi:hypothetical protein